VKTFAPSGLPGRASVGALEHAGAAERDEPKLMSPVAA
jgi:hypothetical protein